MFSLLAVLILYDIDHSRLLSIKKNFEDFKKGMI